MKRKILSVVLVLVMVLSIAGAAFAASTVDLSKYAGTYAIKQGTSTVAKITFKYENSKLSVSANSKTWYTLTKKTGTTFTVAKLNLTIKFTSTSALTYTQSGLFSITLKGTKIASPKPAAKAVTEKDYAGKYTMEKGCPLPNIWIKFENGTLKFSQDGAAYYDLKKESTAKYCLVLDPNTKIVFTVNKVAVTSEGETFSGTK